MLCGGEHNSVVLFTCYTYTNETISSATAEKQRVSCACLFRRRREIHWTRQPVA